MQSVGRDLKLPMKVKHVYMLIKHLSEIITIQIIIIKKVTHTLLLYSLAGSFLELFGALLKINFFLSVIKFENMLIYICLFFYFFITIFTIVSWLENYLMNHWFWKLLENLYDVYVTVTSFGVNLI